MEVKIKIGDEMLDATIEMVDGVMVVSPKEVKYMYEEGEVIVARSAYKHILIYKEFTKGYLYSFADLIESVLDIDDTPVCKECDITEIRPATEKEKKKLFDKLAEEGWEWKPDTKELVKLKWKPKLHEQYFAPWINMGERVSFFRDNLEWENDSIDKELFEKGWVFKTDEDCQELVDKLNQAIEGVKL